MGIKKRIQYRYTVTGQKSLMIDPDGGRHTYIYDNVKRLSQIINPQGERTTFAYDAAGRRTVKKLANGSRTSFSYDAADRMTTVAQLKADASVQARFDYAYDVVGNRTRVAELDGSRVTYLYDDLDQLVGEHRTGTNPYRNTFTYDNRGNRLLKNLSGARTTATYDAANQLSWTQDVGGRTTYIYDGNGNQEVTIAPSSARTTNVWDYENRLVGVRHPSGSRETMAYDPDGKRLQHETGASTTKYVWNGQSYLLETDASGVTVATYTNEPTTYGRLVSQRKSGASHYYIFDALGSTRLLTDSSQNVAETLLCDAWGNLVGTAPSMVVPFRWGGEFGYLYVSSTADYYVRERVYRPTIGRWISQDRVLFLLRQLYLLSGNRPTLLVDPSGRQEVGQDELDTLEELIDCEKVKQQQAEAELPMSAVSGATQQDLKLACESLIQWHLEHNPCVSKIFQSLNNHRCRPITFLCECCKEITKGGEFIPGNRAALVPADDRLIICMKEGWENSIGSTLAHEMTHASQYCIDYPYYSSAQQSNNPLEACFAELLAEIQAYFTEGACTTFSECLTKALKSACHTSCKTNLVKELLPDVIRWWNDDGHRLHGYVDVTFTLLGGRPMQYMVWRELGCGSPPNITPQDSADVAGIVGDNQAKCCFQE